jgi:branched-chain amino acid transport system permease protein
VIGKEDEDWVYSKTMQIVTSLINAIISGIILGALYAVMSMGLTLIYGVGRMFNFAHGAFIFWGGYFTWFFYSKSQLNYWLAIVLGIVILFILGLVVDRIILQSLRKKPDFGIIAVLVTLGLAIIMGNAGDVIFGTRIKTIPKIIEGFLKVRDFTITYNDLATLVISVFVLLCLELFLRKTTVGTALRAISQDSIGARIVGINLDRLFAFTLALSAALGGISGVLLAPRFFIAPFVGWEMLFKAVIIVIFGGLGSVKGTLISAFILGTLEAFVSMYLGMFWVQPMWFIFLVGVLFVKPKGLFGEWA